jgi:serpin B
MVNIRGSFGLGSVLALVGLGLLSGGCSGNDRDKQGDVEAGGVVAELRSAEPRVTPDVSESIAASKSEQEFAVSFLHALDADSNVTFSPHSLSTAFAMVTDAAEGQTLEEIQQVLAFGNADEAFHRSQDALALGLSARSREAVDDGHQKVDAQILNASNDIWIRDDAPPQPSYLDTLARYYGVGVHHADFPDQPEQARVAINSKVSKDTHELISELIPEKAITPDTIAVLTNAMYFKAPWATPLNAPVPGDFHALDGSTSSASMLKTGGTLRYYAGEQYVSVGLPYYGGQLEMMLIVPDLGAYAAVRAALSSEMLTQMVVAGAPEPVVLTLPKFEMKSLVPATATLKAIGMKTPFASDAAQFPKLTSPTYPSVYISDVLHQATVAIDEKGTEASAATAILFSGISAAIDTPTPPPPKVVVADRPFLFVIRDNPTGAVLFLGQVVDP